MGRSARIKGEWDALQEKIYRSEIRDEIDYILWQCRHALKVQKLLASLREQMEADAQGYGINGEIFTRIRNLSPKT